MPIKMLPPPPGGFLPLIDVSEITRKWLDVDYTPQNPHPARKLDVFLPETGDGPFPTIVCIHGGAFSAGTKNDFQVAAYFEGLERGYAVVSVEQRLCNPLPDGGYNIEGQFPNPVFDFKAAIHYLKANAAQYKLDVNRFATAGGSAGGYHAIMAAVTQNVPAMYDDSLGWADVDGSVHAVVDWFGVSDVVVQSEFAVANPTMTMPDGTEVSMPNFMDIFVGASCIEYPHLAYFASPDSWVTKDMPPVLLQHGAADMIVTVECSRRLAKRIEEVCGKDRVTYDEFEDYTHGDMRFNDPENINRMFDWIDEKLK